MWLAVKMADILLFFRELNPLLFACLAGLLGLFFGSFYNVVIARLPRMMELAWQQECRQLCMASTCSLASDSLEVLTLSHPRSHCPRCKQAICNRHNIPLLGWLVLKAKCFNCHLPISIRYPAIEFLTGLLFAITAYFLGPSLALLMAWFFLSVLLCLFFIDLDTFLLPDSLTIPLMWIGILYHVIDAPHSRLVDSVLGAVFGYLILFSVAWLFKRLTGKEGMGAGDFKLLAALGAWTGVTYLPLIILGASVLGLLMSLLSYLMGRFKNEPVPFGPYLSLSGALMYFFGPQMMVYLF
jgi:leader peptidase (prepilin peptidase)/N-methyltransferase